MISEKVEALKKNVQNHFDEIDQQIQNERKGSLPDKEQYKSYNSRKHSCNDFSHKNSEDR